MALRDLVGTKSALTEEAIETIVRGFVTYDEQAREVILTPEGARLPVRSKILVYLTALLGWPFITTEGVPVDARPIDVENATGIAGGSIRRTLIELAEARLIGSQNGRYFVRPTSFVAISAEIATPGLAAPRRSSRKTKKPDIKAVEE